MSPFRVARAFTRATGLAPHQFLLSRQLDRAVELLEERPDLTLGGYCSGDGTRARKPSGQGASTTRRRKPAFYRTRILP